MLSKIDNETVCRVGPGTPMGDLMRQYWLPALLSSELPAPDCDPVRVVLLGEQLIAFRDTTGEVGLLERLPAPRRVAVLRPQRGGGPPLRLPRLEVRRRRQLRRHAQRAGRERTSRHKVKADAYPAQERNGIVWAYMGPRATPPPLPDLEANNLPEGEYASSAIQRECNWLQASKATSTPATSASCTSAPPARDRAARHVPVLRAEGTRAALPGRRHRVRLDVYGATGR